MPPSRLGSGKLFPGAKILTTFIQRKSLSGERGLRCGAAAVMGRRVRMEDATVVELCKDWCLLGVFDGHNGPKCSKFVSQYIVQRMRESGPPADDAGIEKLCTDADVAFLGTGKPGGSTGAFVIAEPKGAGWRLRAASVGDSRTLLYRSSASGGDRFVEMSKDHTIDCEFERSRIETAGGRVQKVDGQWRLVGRSGSLLAMTRAFGDAEYKYTGEDATGLTAEPTLCTAEAEVGDVIVICSDGVFDHGWSTPDLLDFVQVRMQGGGDAGGAASEAARRGVMRGGDNSSCIVVRLGDPSGSPPDKDELLLGPFDTWRDPLFRKAWLNMARWAGREPCHALAQRGAVAFAALQKHGASSSIRTLTVTKASDGKVGVNYADLVVRRVTPGGAAEQAGVRPGMHLVKIGSVMLESQLHAQRTFEKAEHTFELTVAEPEEGDPLEQSRRAHSDAVAVGTLRAELEFWAEGDGEQRTLEQILQPLPDESEDARLARMSERAESALRSLEALGEALVDT
eukprot:TRINITY_DN17382_c0_g1_i2.p1 TRINITY_DN17382_c0_g1~~TRINITY_DN17382_c0_g1_i2.p1  ORF type:complete len:582 (+),score=160.98 TRINITY_DN17382_c0_g1_i2:212-1747(+)